MARALARRAASASSSWALMASDAPLAMPEISLQRASKASRGFRYSRFTAFLRSSICLTMPLRNVRSRFAPLTFSSLDMS